MREYVRTKDHNFPQERVDVARMLYEQGKRVAFIARATGISRYTLYRYAEKYGWKRPGDAFTEDTESSAGQPPLHDSQSSSAETKGTSLNGTGTKAEQTVELEPMLFKVLKCLFEAKARLTAGQIRWRERISEDEWPSIEHQLLEQGLVLKSGRDRWARYELGDKQLAATLAQT